jgi:hypothetical protein
MAEESRQVPPDLSSRAAGFWARTVDNYDLTDGELELLAECVVTMSEIDALREALAADGVTVAGSRGQRRVHPAVGEVRQHRMALARLLKAIALPAEDESESWATKNARAAALARWSREAR